MKSLTTIHEVCTMLTVDRLSWVANYESNNSLESYLRPKLQAFLKTNIYTLDAELKAELLASFSQFRDHKQTEGLSYEIIEYLHTGTIVNGLSVSILRIFHLINGDVTSCSSKLNKLGADRYKPEYAGLVSNVHLQALLSNVLHSWASTLIAHIWKHTPELFDAYRDQFKELINMHLLPREPDENDLLSSENDSSQSVANDKWEAQTADFEDDKERPISERRYAHPNAGFVEPFINHFDKLLKSHFDFPEKSVFLNRLNLAVIAHTDESERKVFVQSVRRKIEKIKDEKIDVFSVSSNHELILIDKIIVKLDGYSNSLLNPSEKELDASKPHLSNLQHYNAFIQELFTLDIKTVDCFVKDGRVLDRDYNNPAHYPADTPQDRLPGFRSICRSLDQYDQHASTDRYVDRLMQLARKAKSELLILQPEQIKRLITEVEIERERLTGLIRKGIEYKKAWDKDALDELPTAFLELQLLEPFTIANRSEATPNSRFAHNLNDALMYKRGILSQFIKQINAIVIDTSTTLNGSLIDVQQPTPDKLTLRQKMLIHCYEEGRVINKDESDYNDYIAFATPAKRVAYSNGSKHKAKPLIKDIQKILPQLSEKARQQAENEMNTIKASIL